LFHATFSFRAEKVKLSKEETGVGISRLFCTAASVSTGLFFCLQPKKLNGEKAKELTLEQKVESQQDARACFHWSLRQRSGWCTWAGLRRDNCA